SSLRRSVRAASRSAFVRRRYSCQSAEDWMRTLGTYASHQPFRGLLQDDPHPADPFVLRAGLHRLLQLLDGGAAGAAGLDGRVGVPVAALLRVPLVGVGAAPRAGFGLVLGVPDRFVAVLLRPHQVPAEEMAVRDAVALADVELEGELRVALQPFPTWIDTVRELTSRAVLTSSTYSACPDAPLAAQSIQSFSDMRSSGGRSCPMQAASSAGPNVSGFHW